MILEPFTLWEIVEGCDNFEGYHKMMVPQFKADKCIPEAIQKKLITIQKLVSYAYYEYEFLDVAMLMTLQCIEFSLHLKYIEKFPTKNGLKNLNPYLSWAIKEKLIKSEDKDGITYLRNLLTHPKDERTFGFIGVKIVKSCFVIIETIFTS